MHLNNTKNLCIEGSPHTLGQIFETPHFCLVFGNKHLGEEALEFAAKKFNFTTEFIQQKHTSKIIKAPTNSQICDGTFTDQPHLGLCIRTADCLPLLASSGEAIYALHCGRRGLLNGIIKNLKDHHRPTASTPWSFFIGPHIQCESYEVGAEIYAQIQKQYPNTQALVRLNNRHCFSLKAFAQEQIQTYFPGAQIFEFEIDTFTNSQYNSYRKDNKTKARNLSFIWKKDSFGL